MGLKRTESYKGFPESEIYYSLVDGRAVARPPFAEATFERYASLAAYKAGDPPLDRINVATSSPSPEMLEVLKAATYTWVTSIDAPELEGATSVIDDGQEPVQSLPG